MVVRGSGCGLI